MHLDSRKIPFYRAVKNGTFSTIYALPVFGRNND
jgi:hypothetical protein